MNAPDLTPILQGQQAARRQYGAQSAANTFSKTLSQQRGNRQIGDMRRGFGRELPKFGAQFGRRGLAGSGIRSGVMQRAMNNYIGDYTRNLGRAQGDMSDNLREFDMNEARFAAERDSTLAGLEAQKAALIAQTAQHIMGLKPLMGGF